ncbi:hypothetical protein BDV93DRAFT_556838 [Ceratobasidium sp. AG-I]|nr:hypothetical protein BDV93DRAFT_556838 [Ceratobasidium sp. AG-I]
MAKRVSLTFLGTSAGGGPTLSRSCTSNALSIDSSIWLVDCAEGTERQMLHAKLKVGRVRKIFVTHLHMDHCMGIAPLMGTLMSAITSTPSKPDIKRLDIFGPRGIRELLRTILKITQSSLAGKYAVHELLSVDDIPYSCEESEMHPNETLGQNLRPTKDSFWMGIDREGGWSVNAGPIKHRVPCLGYVFQESPHATRLDPLEHIEPIDRNSEALVKQGVRNPRSLLGQLLRTRQPILLPDGTVLRPPPFAIPGRKLVVLGDTSDPWAAKELFMDASLLVHEATNAYIPSHMDPQGPKQDTEASVKERAVQRGHSTPVMAGEFARAIRARGLILNHFGSRQV